MKNCGTCQWWRQDLQDLTVVQGTCHGDIPKVYIVPHPKGLSNITVWPVTKPGEGCSHHESRLEV